MSRIFFLILFLVFLFAMLTWGKTVYAQTVDTCKVSTAITEPSPIYSHGAKTPTAKFIAVVGDNSAYKDWKMQFECGFPQNVGTATKEGTDKISREMNNGGCEFHNGQHTIRVIGVNDKGVDVHHCFVSYRVEDAERLCELDLDPSTEIHANKDIFVSGKNLAPGGQYALFIDETRIAGGVGGFLPTPTFPNIPIPATLLTPRSHQVSIRKYNIGPLDDIKQYSFSLCSLCFTVGTPDNPGGLCTIDPKKGTPPKPATASGKLISGCTGDEKNPGISTAIGCIHTNPNEFAKDLLTFLLGIGGGVAFLMMLLGAFQMLTSAGNPDTLRAGKERLTSALIGLLIVIFSVLLLQIIGFDILRIPGFRR